MGCDLLLGESVVGGQAASWPARAESLLLTRAPLDYLARARDRFHCREPELASLSQLPSIFRSHSLLVSQCVSLSYLPDLLAL